MDFVPAVRSGRRAPHVWIDDAQTVSVLDGFGDGYSLVLGAGVDAKGWSGPVDALAERGLPIAVQVLSDREGPYATDDVVLVRPDGIIADHWKGGEVAAADRPVRLARFLPLL